MKGKSMSAQNKPAAGVASRDDSMQRDMHINNSSAGDSAQKTLHGTVSAEEYMRLMASKINTKEAKRLRTMWDAYTSEARSCHGSDTGDKLRSVIAKIGKVESTYKRFEIRAFFRRLQTECLFHAVESVKLDKETNDWSRELAMECIASSVLYQPWSIEYHQTLASISYHWGIAVDLNALDNTVLSRVDSGGDIPFIDPKYSLCLPTTSESKEERIRSCLEEYEKIGKNEITSVMLAFNKNKNMKELNQSMSQIFSKYKVSRSLRSMSCRLISQCYLEESVEQAVVSAKSSACILNDKCVEGWYWVASLLSTSSPPLDDWELVLKICDKGLSLTEIDILSVWMVQISNMISSNRRNFSIQNYKDEFERIRTLAVENIVQVVGEKESEVADDAPNLEEGNF